MKAYLIINSVLFVLSIRLLLRWGSETSKPVTNQIMFYIGMAIWSLYLLTTVW